MAGSNDDLWGSGRVCVLSCTTAFKYGSFSNSGTERGLAERSGMA